MNHLEDLDAVSESIGLRAYGQRDPLVEYRGEAHKLYNEFWHLVMNYYSLFLFSSYFSFFLFIFFLSLLLFF